MDVEVLAVNKITDMVASCPHLQAIISTNDKTPFTDGHIDIYAGLRQSKSEFIGRVPVQVKGRTVRSNKRSSPTHPISRTDLRAFQKDSGVLYFVVAVEPKSLRRTAYYALLSPFAIEQILNNVPADQKQVSVALRKLPHEPNGIESIVRLALKTRDQNIALGFDPILFERLQSLTVYTAFGLDFDAPVTLAPGVNDFALVLHTTDGMSVPLGGEIQIFPPDYTKRTIDVRVRAGAITYGGGTLQRIDAQVHELELSEGLKILLRNAPDNQTASVSLTLERTLAGRLKAIEFYTALLDTHLLEVDGVSSRLEIANTGETSTLRDHLHTLHAMTELFDHLGVDTQLIDLHQIDEQQARQLNVLHRGFVEKLEISDSSVEASRVLQQVGQWSLLFLISPGSAPNKWRLNDPFSTEFRSQFRWSAEEGGKDVIPVTAYDVVEEEHLSTVLNMRLDSIVGAYEAISDFPSTYTLANQRVLALITASDSSDMRRNQLLTAAASLNSWLIDEEGDTPSHLINRWQISSRVGALSPEERSDIRRLKRQVAIDGAPNSDHVELACALLLGDNGETQYLLRAIAPEKLEQMQTWPIWKLYTPGSP